MTTTKLFTGAPSTLGSYQDLCAAVFGKGSKPAKFFDAKIQASPQGRDEEVIAPESQMMMLIGSMLQ